VRLFPNTGDLSCIMVVDDRAIQWRWRRAAEGKRVSLAEHPKATDRRSSEAPLLRAFLDRRQFLECIAAGMGMAGADIDDVLQDVSIQVLKYADQIREEKHMVRWLVKTTVNQCLMEHRRRFHRRAPELLKRRPDLGTAFSLTAEPARQAGISEELEIIRNTLAELDPNLLQVMVLRYFGELDSKEIGSTLELNASTVRSRLREARMVLAGKLRQRGIES